MRHNLVRNGTLGLMCMALAIMLNAGAMRVSPGSDDLLCSCLCGLFLGTVVTYLPVSRGLGDLIVGLLSGALAVGYFGIVRQSHGYFIDEIVILISLASLGGLVLG